VEELLGKLTTFGLWAGLFFVLIALTVFLHQRLLAFYANKPTKQHHRALIALCLYILMTILAVILMPVGDAMRGQLLQFLGILLSATIALSSTTIVGNAVAGFMLKTLRNFRPGDFISIDDHFGRVTNMDLLHVEIQTEDRDLTTLPNLYLVTNPVKVLRSSGTILHVEVSIGYDTPHAEVEKALLAAAEATELESPFAQVLELGDFSVSYRISGLMEDISKLISTRRRLRANTLDALHAASIEIMSPSYMATRAVNSVDRVMPGVHMPAAPSQDEADPDALAFDKAQRADELDELKREYTTLSQELIKVEQALKEAGPGDARRPITLQKKSIEAKLARQEKQITSLENNLVGKDD
jgi:small conductance mechanosensitive channel